MTNNKRTVLTTVTALTVFLLLLASSLSADLGFDNQAVVAEPPAEIVKVTSAFSMTSAPAGGSYEAALVVEIIPGWHINSAFPYQDWLIPAQVTFGEVTGFTAGEVRWPEAQQAKLLDETMAVFGGRTIIPFEITITSSTAPGEYLLPVSFTFQPCNDQTCIAPETVAVPLAITVGEAGQPANTDVFSTSDRPTTESASPAGQSAQSDNEIQRLIDEHGLWGYFIALGLAFVTGLLLSFSPCTYPMIPITVSIFAGQDRTVFKGFIMSLFYVGSMAVVYGIMGLIVSSVGGVFGAWLASKPVVIGIAVVFVIFALSMFGLYEIQVPMFLRQKLGTTKGGGGIGGAIVLGLVAALVVSPCVGPFVAGILLYVATSGSPFIGFITLFVFALGLGTLFVIIGTFSNAINKLPGAGEWMEQVKKFFGFVLILMAIYFLRTIVPVSVTAILTAVLLLAFAVFGGGLDRLTPEAGFFARLKKFLGLVAAVLGLYLLLGSILVGGFILPPASEWLPVASGGTAAAEQHIPWETDLTTGMQKAAAESKPVVIDTWATWCANCRVLEKKTFGHPDVINKADRFVAIKVQLENSRTPETQEFMTRFGMKHYSLPTTLLIDSKGTVQKVIQGVIGPQEMAAEMDRIH